MKKILQILFSHQLLSKEQAKEVMLNIGRNVYNEYEVTAFMTAYLMRSITIEELQGFKEALLELCVKINFKGIETVDIVGTGGDGKNTFNISTLSCFIVAGAGFKVTKHGNYGATSISGSSNVMEQLGYKFKNNSSDLEKELEATNICFLHAPLFHPALKAVSVIRKNVGVRTFFNMLGPLVNPANPASQLIGVFNLEMARIYNYILQKSDTKFSIVYCLNGYDEISLTNDTKIINRTGEKIVSAMELGKRSVSETDIQGGNSVQESSKIFLKILKGEGTWAQNSVLFANAALALFNTNEFNNYDDAYQTAIESFESGKAFNSFNRLIQMQ